MRDILPCYIHQINPKLKYTYLSFDNEGNLIIRSPKLSTVKIEQLLLKKSAWIKRARERLKEMKRSTTSFTPHSQIYFLGQNYPINLYPHDQKGIALRFDGAKFTIGYDHFNPQYISKALDSFYKKEAPRIILPIIEKWSQHMKLSPKGVTFRKTKRQWGSCSAKNQLSLNTMLCKVPIECIEYVIVHELAHIRYKHHQKPFWDLVGTFMPDYKHHIRTLRSYAT